MPKSRKGSADTVASIDDVRELQAKSIEYLEAHRLKHPEPNTVVQSVNSLTKKQVIAGSFGVVALATVITIGVNSFMSGSGEASQGISDTENAGLIGRAFDMVTNNDHKVDVALPFSLPSRDGGESVVDPFMITLDDRTKTQYFPSADIVGMVVQADAVPLEAYESARISLKTAPNDLHPEGIYQAFQTADNSQDCADLSQAMMDTVRSNPDLFADSANGFTPSEYRRNNIHHRTDFSPFTDLPMPEAVGNERLKFVIFYDDDKALICPGES